MEWPGGTSATPFVWFNTVGTQANPALLKEARISRTWGCVKRSAELLMVVEAANPNFNDPTPSTKYSNPPLYLKRLGARHGQKTADRANAWTNMAFFDGHVALFPSVRFNYGPASAPTRPQDKFKSETIFWLSLQK
jgi:prepilin-type processing-associated H-X9-DG protein